MTFICLPNYVEYPQIIYLFIFFLKAVEERGIGGERTGDPSKEQLIF